MNQYFVYNQQVHSLKVSLQEKLDFEKREGRTRRYYSLSCGPGKVTYWSKQVNK